MPEQRQPNQLIGGLVMFGAAITCAIAAVIYTNVIDIGEARGLATGILGIVALSEFAAGVWFFSRGQSS